MLKQNDFENFSTIVSGIGLSFDKDVKAEQIMIYWQVLADEFEDIKHFSEVAKKVLKSWSYSYMPKPAHFIQAKELNSDEIELIANKAYELAKDTAKRFSVYDNIVFEDKAIMETLSIVAGSWKEFCEKVSYRNSDDTWIRKEFIKIYKIVAKKKEYKTQALRGYLNESKKAKLIKTTYQAPALELKKPEKIDPRVLAMMSGKINRVGMGKMRISFEDELEKAKARLNA